MSQSTSFIGQGGGMGKGLKPGAGAWGVCGANGGPQRGRRGEQSSQWVVWWTCSWEEMTLPSLTSSTMVRTWRVVAAAGDRHSGWAGAKRSWLSPQPHERSQLSPPPWPLGVHTSAGPSTSHPYRCPPDLATPSLAPCSLLVPLGESCLLNRWFDSDPHVLLQEEDCTDWTLHEMGSVSISLQSQGHGSCSLQKRISKTRPWSTPLD